MGHTNRPRPGGVQSRYADERGERLGRVGLMAAVALALGTALVWLLTRSGARDEIGQQQDATAAADVAEELIVVDVGGVASRVAIASPTLEAAPVQQMDRGPLFSGVWDARDFMRQWWGAQWPTVEDWLREQDMLEFLPSGDWDMREQMLPEEALARATAEFSEQAFGGKGAQREAMRAAQIARLSELPLDRAESQGEDGFRLDTVDGEPKLLSNDEFEAFRAACAPAKQRMAAAASAMIHERENLTMDAIERGDVKLSPFVDHFPTEYLSCGQDQALYTSYSGIWNARLKIDYSKSSIYMAHKHEHDAATSAAFDFYHALLSTY